jgi:hypothetical protein
MEPWGAKLEGGYAAGRTTAALSCSHGITTTTTTTGTV